MWMTCALSSMASLICHNSRSEAAIVGRPSVRCVGTSRVVVSFSPAMDELPTRLARQVLADYDVYVCAGIESLILGPRRLADAS